MLIHRECDFKLLKVECIVGIHHCMMAISISKCVPCWFHNTKQSGLSVKCLYSMEQICRSWRCLIFYDMNGFVLTTARSPLINSGRRMLTSWYFVLSSASILNFNWFCDVRFLPSFIFFQNHISDLTRICVLNFITCQFCSFVAGFL